MSCHWIRLRGGWEWHRSSPKSSGTRGHRLTLPVEARDDGPPVGWLVRSFQKPPIDPSTERVWLALRSVDGLGSIQLNDRALAASLDQNGSCILPVDDLLDGRNSLVLEVERLAIPKGEATLLWGDVALVISPMAEFPRA